MSRVAVIGGGANGEHEVSLASAAGVAAALAGRHGVVRLTIGRDGGWRDGAGVPLTLAAAVEIVSACEVVVPMVHGPRGEDGTLAALCELAGLPYVGSPLGAGALAMDKWATKLVAEAVGVSTASARLLRAGSAAGFDGPCVVKPVAAGSSLGVSLVTTAEQLPPALEEAFVHDDRVLVEELVVGREIDLAVLGRPDGTRLVAPALEIAATGTPTAATPGPRIFDFATKYDGSARFVVPAPLTDAESGTLHEAAVRVYDALGCAGVARIDFFLTADGPVLNEVNTAPGFTEHSQVPRMFAAGGTSYADLLDLLIADALR